MNRNTSTPPNNTAPSSLVESKVVAESAAVTRSTVTIRRDDITFGVKTSQSNVTYAEILKLWLEADTLPVFEHAWLWDHMITLRGPTSSATLEAWTLLAALAAQTQRIRLGVMVTDNRLRRPTVLAKMAATVDVIAGGRLDFGIGAGGSAVSDEGARAMVHREFDAYGIEVVRPSEAIVALDEACTIAKRLWDEDEPFDFDGIAYQLKGAICEPKPVQRPHPPIVIGAGGEQLALRVVANHADIWNCPTRGDVAEFTHKNAVLDAHCAAIGRDPAEIVRSVQVLVVQDAPASARDLLVGFIEAGARHLILTPMPPYPSLGRLVDEVVEPVLAAVA
jgi:alkanesulfonate monooxygenase SsuD/methylene tetrahydromethanopterin reductase-like flavin-dependent oxidoreductase (luciferase family)